MRRSVANSIANAGEGESASATLPAQSLRVDAQFLGGSLLSPRLWQLGDHSCFGPGVGARLATKTISHIAHIIAPAPAKHCPIQSEPRPSIFASPAKAAKTKARSVNQQAPVISHMFFIPAS